MFKQCQLGLEYKSAKSVYSTYHLKVYNLYSISIYSSEYKSIFEIVKTYSYSKDDDITFPMKVISVTYFLIYQYHYILDKTQNI